MTSFIPLSTKVNTQDNSKYHLLAESNCCCVKLFLGTQHNWKGKSTNRREVEASVCMHVFMCMCVYSRFQETVVSVEIVAQQVGRQGKKFLTPHLPESDASSSLLLSSSSSSSFSRSQAPPAPWLRPPVKR